VIARAQKTKDFEFLRVSRDAKIQGEFGWERENLTCVGSQMLSKVSLEADS
jgi:hypothetical protein